MTVRIPLRPPLDRSALLAFLAVPGVEAARAEAWRPWRPYAAQHLWVRDAARPRR